MWGPRRPSTADRIDFRALAARVRARRLSTPSPPVSGDDNTGPTGPIEANMAETTSHKPKLHAYFVKPPKNEDGKPVWIKVGAAFENRDGSLSVVLDCIPPPEGLAGWRLQLREPYDEEAAAAGEGKPAAAAKPAGKPAGYGRR